jgi:hypothetical protein
VSKGRLSGLRVRSVKSGGSRVKQDKEAVIDILEAVKRHRLGDSKVLGLPQSPRITLLAPSHDLPPTKTLL